MKKDRLKLSICICTFNRLAYLRLTIFRIIQELKGLSFEIVVVDGGSKDGTIEFLESNELKKKVSIVLIKQKKLIGATKSYVAGFEKSRGDYVFPLPDHTIIHGRPFIESIRILDNQPEIGGVIQKFRATTNKLRNPHAVFHSKLKYFTLGEQIIYRKEIIKKINFNYHTHYWTCDLMLSALMEGWEICHTKKLSCEHINIGRDDDLHSIVSTNRITSKDYKYFLDKWSYLSQLVIDNTPRKKIFFYKFTYNIITYTLRILNSKKLFMIKQFFIIKKPKKSIIPETYKYPLPREFSANIDFKHKSSYFEFIFDKILNLNSLFINSRSNKKFFLFQKFPEYLKSKPPT